MKIRHEDNKVRELKRFVNETGVTRRDFMQKAAALGLLSAAPTVWSSRAKAAQKGGRLRAGVLGGASTDSLDPRDTIGTQHVSASALTVYETLTEVDANGNAVPVLAESWDVSDDGSDWTFNLKKGVTFHNGKEMTAEDVIWSFRNISQEGTRYPEGKQIIGNFETMVADGKYTVRFKQKQANLDLPIHFSPPGMFVVPAETTNFSAGVGTGPYTLEYFEAGVRFAANRFDNYHADTWFDEVEYLNIADATARANGLITGELDVITRPDYKIADRIEASPNLSIWNVEANQHYTTPMLVDKEPFTDNNVRLAIKYAINREELVSKVFAGFGYVGNDHPIGRTQQFYNTDLPQRTYDPEKAKWHLKQAGLTSIDVELNASDGAFTGSNDAAALMKESAKAAGINITPKRVPGDGYWSEVWTKVPFCFCYWNGRPTVDWMFSLGYVGEDSWNDTNFRSAQLDELIVNARTEKDQDKRRQMYFDAQEIVHNDGGTAIFAFGTHIHGVSDKLVRVDDNMGGSYSLDDYRFAKRWAFGA